MKIIKLLILILVLIGCGDDSEFTQEQEPEQTEIVEEVEPVEEVQSVDYFVPDNCSNPPKRISQADGFKCIASATRGGSVVCLLPYQFTWSPYKDFTDHHGVTMDCNSTDTRFDSVKLFLNNGKVHDMTWADCQNWVGTARGKIGRQHWRIESVQWSKIKDKVRLLEMTVNGQKTCLDMS